MLTPITLDGYIQWVHPWRASPSNMFYMLGDHGCYCPVHFANERARP